MIYRYPHNSVFYSLHLAVQNNNNILISQLAQR